MGLIVFFLWRTMKMMPKTKPQEIKPDSAVVDRLGRRGRRRRGQGRAAGGRRLPARPGALPRARRQGAQGHPAARPARHGQDAAGQGRGQRVRRALLLPVGRRRSSRCSPASAPRASGGCSPRPASTRPAIVFIDEIDAVGGQPRLGQQLRARADAQPAAGGDGRLRLLAASSWSSPPPTCSRSSTPRCCAPAASTARSSSRRPTSPAARRSSRVHTRNKPLARRRLRA